MIVYELTSYANFHKIGGTMASLQYGVQNRIQVQMHPWMLVETARVTEFEYYFACTRTGVHLYSDMSPGKIIFAVLEL